MFKLSTLAVCLVLLPGATLADQLTLTNGDRISGKIIKKDGDALVMKTDLMGDVTLKWISVASVVTEAPITVVLPEGKSVRGTITTADGKAVVTGESGTTETTLPAISALRNESEQHKYERYLRPPWSDLWVGFIDFSIASASGNARTLVYTTSMNANRVTPRDKLSLHFNQIYSKGLLANQLVATASAIRGGWSYDHNLSPRVFWNVFNDYEYDRFQNLDLRSVLGTGVGYHLVKSERGTFDLLGGGSWNREQYATPLQSELAGQIGPTVRNSGEIYVGDDLVWKLTGFSNIKQDFRTFFNASNLGEYRANFDLGLDTRIMRKLAWQVTISDRYITNPAPGRKTNDLLISSGIRYTFSRVP